MLVKYEKSGRKLLLEMRGGSLAMRRSTRRKRGRGEKQFVVSSDTLLRDLKVQARNIITTLRFEKFVNYATMSFDYYNYFNFLNFSPIFDEVVEDHVLVFYEGIGQQGKERYFGKRKRYTVTCISVIEIIICGKG